MRVLAVGAHPDDVETYCGGTLVRYAQRGDDVWVLVCTDGGGGHQVIPTEELIPIREREAQAAAVALGAQLVMLGEPDGGLFAEAATRKKMREVFAEVRPEVVLAHPPQDYHPDHRAASRLAEEACGLAGGSLTPYLLSLQEGGEKRGPALLYMDTQEGLGFVPDLYVDISGEAVERKLAALSCHRSQVDWLAHHDGIDLLEWVRGAARTRGIQCGLEYAETFRMAPGWGRVKTWAMLP